MPVRFGILAGLGQHRLDSAPAASIELGLDIRTSNVFASVVRLFGRLQIAVDLVLASFQAIQDDWPNELGQNREDAKENGDVANGRPDVELQQRRRAGRVAMSFLMITSLIASFVTRIASFVTRIASCHVFFGRRLIFRPDRHRSGKHEHRQQRQTN